MEEIYLDNSATTRVCEKSAEKVLELMTQCYGNPSSLHKKGLEAQREVAHARQAVAVSLGAQPREIIFTSGGTEANNLAVLGGAAAGRRRGKRIVTTAIEHPSVLEPMRQLEKEGFEVVFLTPDTDGRVPEEAVLKAVTGDTILISVMAVNNELGSIQPIEVLKKAVKRAGAPALVHVDGVQAYGKLPLRPEKLGIDLLTVSGHKIHGPKGVGALYVSKNARILPRTFGGGQERELRPGTEAAPLIAGLGAAVEELPDWRQAYSRMEKLRDYTLQKLSGLEGVEVNSPVEGRPLSAEFFRFGDPQRNHAAFSGSAGNLCILRIRLCEGKAKPCAESGRPAGQPNFLGNPGRLFPGKHRAGRGRPGGRRAGGPGLPGQSQEIAAGSWPAACRTAEFPRRSG